MRSKQCDDGQWRIAAKVEVLVDINDITNFALSNPRHGDSDNPLNDFLNLNKRQVFSMAKETIKTFGTEWDAMDHIIASLWSDNQRKRAEAHIYSLFPEITK